MVKATYERRRAQRIFSERYETQRLGCHRQLLIDPPTIYFNLETPCPAYQEKRKNLNTYTKNTE